MKLALFFVLLLVAQVAFALEAAPQSAAWYQERAALRKSRMAIEQGAADDRVERATRAVKVVEDLLTKAKEMGIGRTDVDLASLVSGVCYLDAATGAPAAVSLAALSEKSTADAKQQKAWLQLLESKRNDLLKPTEKLFKLALDAGVPAVARDCVDQALAFWPDHKNLRRNLGQIKFEDRWYVTREADMTKQGFAWDNKLGWVVVKDRARYAKGDYYDLQAKQWTTLAAVNALRSEAKNRWVIQTEHLEIRGTAPLEVLVDAANRIEAFFDRVFAAYSGFFLKVSGKKVSDDDFKVLFGTLRKEKGAEKYKDKEKERDRDLLVVNVAKDKDAYVASLPPMVTAGWSDGMFISSTKESYFYQGEAEVIYHEFTHQILHIFSGTNRSPAWLAEGAAVYTQAPAFHEGRMVLGEIDGNQHLRAFFHQMKEGKALSLQQILALDDGRVWSSSTTPDLNYPAAGILVQFCMESDNRRHRSDFLDFLRDSYLGTTLNYKVWDYLGLKYSTFDKSLTDWLGETAKLQAERKAERKKPNEK